MTPIKKGPSVVMSETPQPQQPRRLVRLIFEYDGDLVRLVAQQPVEMAVAEEAAEAGERLGFFVDARDSNERTLARVAARGAFAGNREVFPERHDEPITRVDVAERKGAFTVTLPAPDPTDHVTLVQLVRAEAAGDRRAAAPDVVDLVSFPLRVIR